ncbi:hypothetical protein GCM10018793_09940 [Streptomyces sulfonofaciens]|uniref:Uncharacterized protein n=1 Tax=Streptomyces sulfonofaciens TaxID=68272 RepID=A0A919FUK7_9ACTN|nr:hypothetical protein [Streptomyces sulfonofaciens]GHH72621.1 hypothetical protein GCM10018793_09940 [Streptomyces sulfonofaciens]
MSPLSAAISGTGSPGGGRSHGRRTAARGPRVAKVNGSESGHPAADAEDERVCQDYHELPMGNQTDFVSICARRVFRIRDPRRNAARPPVQRAAGYRAEGN